LGLIGLAGRLAKRQTATVYRDPYQTTGTTTKH
jgi:hypothetical protein